MIEKIFGLEYIKAIVLCQQRGGVNAVYNKIRDGLTAQDTNDMDSFTVTSIWLESIFLITTYAR